MRCAETLNAVIAGLEALDKDGKDQWRAHQVVNRIALAAGFKVGKSGYFIKEGQQHGHS